MGEGRWESQARCEEERSLFPPEGEGWESNTVQVPHGQSHEMVCLKSGHQNVPRPLLVSAGGTERRDTLNCAVGERYEMTHWLAARLCGGSFDVVDGSRALGGSSPTNEPAVERGSSWSLATYLLPPVLLPLADSLADC